MRRTLILICGTCLIFAGCKKESPTSGTGATVSVSVVADKDSLPADGLSAAAVTATVTYSDNSSTEGLQVKFYTTLGTITGCDTTDSGGIATATMVSGTNAGPAEIAASCLKRTGSVYVTLFAMQDNGVYVSSLTAVPDSIPANGLSQSIISAVFNDDSDQPAESLIVNFSATLGAVTACDTTDSMGMVTGTLISSVLPGISNVRVWYGQARDSIDVVFVDGGEVGDTIPASIVLYQVYPTSIAVQGSGGNETSTLTFEVRDATGRPVSGTSIVDFVINGGPSGGEYLHPISAPTETGALATTHLNSGTVSGPARVVAQVQGTSIFSGPVEVTIVGGPPEQTHFCVVTEKLNRYAFGIAGVENMITAYVGDQYGNPVQNGTAVWFSTECGIIQSGAGNTESGITANTLVSCAPWPSVTGLFYAHAWTIDGAGGVIRDSVSVLWSGVTILNLTPTSFNIPEGSSESFTFTVCDVRNNPLTEGTTISIVADAGKLRGPSSIKIPDTQSSWTHFDFLLCDNPDDTVATSCEVVVEVISDNGDRSAHAYGIVH